MEQLLWIFVGGVPSLLVGIVLAKMKKNEDKATQLEADRDEREELILEAMDAIFSITKELVDCVLFEKEPNGELEKAYAYKQEVKHKIRAYQRKKASR